MHWLFYWFAPPRVRRRLRAIRAETAWLQKETKKLNEFNRKFWFEEMPQLCEDVRPFL
jgi:hypothetical protein